MVLKPIIPKLDIEHLLERELNGWMKEVIFDPLWLAFEDGLERINAHIDPLFTALQEGRINYANGVFSGRFTAATSRELRRLGATWDRTAKTFNLPQWKIPYNLRGVLASSAERSKSAHAKVVDTAATIAENVATSPRLGLNLGQYVNRLLDSLDRQFTDAVHAADKNIEVPMQMSEAARQKLTETLTENLELSIKGWLPEQVTELRKLAEENFAAGGRVDRLARIIESRWGVGQRKAAFLAAQETSMIASTFTEEKAKDIGSESYVWYCRHDYRVRPDHQALNGTVQTWSNPPVVDRATGRRANPGMDYRCRCVARPIINLSTR